MSEIEESGVITKPLSMVLQSAGIESQEALLFRVTVAFTFVSSASLRVTSTK